jgi:Fe-S-cluster-containing hydrogenase component 2
MSTDVYERLAQHLDDHPSGYPRTESGVEMRILRRLFTPEEAELTLHISLIEESAPVIARRAKIPVDEAARILEGMEEKGLVFAYHRKGQPPQYMSTGFIVGFFEFQLEKLTPELVADLHEYNPTWFDLDTWKKAPQIRTVPVGESIPGQGEVLPYEQAAELVRMQRKFAVANCVCQQERLVAGDDCAKPSERCLSFGASADYIVRNGMGRFITQDEVLGILDLADQAGLVLQPANARKAAFICACCGCCCGVLRNLKRHPKPASVVSSPYYAVLDVEICDGCGTCETRCQMEAIHLDNGCAALEIDRCIGCGLCVTTCPNEALCLERKPAAELPHIPKNLVDTNIRLGKARGKLTNTDLVKLLVKSKVDRLLAAK